MNSNNATIAEGPTTAARKRLEKIFNVDPADHVLAVIDEYAGDSFEVGVLWAALMIGVELRGIRTAVEDIASAMMQPTIGDDVPNDK